MRVKIGKNERVLEDKELSRAVEDFCDLKLAFDDLNEKLKPLKELIGNRAKELLSNSDSSTINFLLESHGVKVNLGFDMKVSDEKNLRTLLGDNWNLLVKSTTIYRPEAKLREMAFNDDAISGCLEIKEKTPSISVI